MAAPLQISEEDRKAVESDARSCAKSLKSFLETGEGAGYVRFRELFSKYFKYSESQNPAEKLKADMFRTAFFGAKKGEGEYILQVAEGRAKKLSDAFEAKHGKFSPLSLADAAYDVYSRVAKGEPIPADLEKSHGEEFVRLARESYYAAHPEKKGTPPPSELVPVRVHLPSHVDDKTIDAFLREFGLEDVLGASKREDKLRSLVATTMALFGLKFPKEGGDVSSALLHAYALLPQEERKQFMNWLGSMETKDRFTLGAILASVASARGLTLPHEKAKEYFGMWKKGQVSIEAKMYALESELKRIPKHIRETSISEMARVFEQNVKDYTLEQMEMRLNFLNKRRELLKLRGAQGKTELPGVEREIASMKAWLEKMGIERKTPEEGLSILRGSLLALQTAYYTISDKNQKLADFVDIAKKNDLLFSIVTKYVYELDKLNNLFQGVRPGDPAFSSKIRRSVESLEAKSDVRRGRQTWFEEYYSPLFAPTGAAAFAPNMMEMRMNILASTLDPVAALAFLDYVKAVRANRLEGGLVRREQEVPVRDPVTGMPVKDPVTGAIKTQKQVINEEPTRKSVVMAVSRLYALHPALVPKYFRAMKHIAELCEDNAKVYRNIMNEILLRIDAMAAPVMSRGFMGQTPPSTMRKNINMLDRALTELIQIPKGSIAQYDRFDLLDQRVFVDSNAPNTISQKPFGFTPRLLTDETRPGGNFTPYPLPRYIVTPAFTSPINVGGVYTSQMNYGGGITMPAFRPLDVFTSVRAVKQSMTGYLWPEHPILSISKILPGTIIPKTSPTKLMNAVMRAFIQVERPDYIGTPIGGGAALGFMGYKSGDSWNVGGGGLGTLLTPSGGYAIGGMRDQFGIFGGAAAMAVPLWSLPEKKGYKALKKSYEEYSGYIKDGRFSKIPEDIRKAILKDADQKSFGPSALEDVLKGKDFKPAASLADALKKGLKKNWLENQLFQIIQRPTTLDTATAGYERFSDSSTKMIARAISSQWDPTNPSQMLLVVNSDNTLEGKWYTTARALYVDKDGTIYDLKGGQNDLVPMLNFLAGYVNKSFGTPSTLAYNWEPTVQRGGGVLAFDLGKTPLLFHAQAIPFLTEEGAPQPLLVQWTLAGATTLDKPGVRTDIHGLAFPGQMLRLKPGASGNAQDDYYVQGIEYMLRRVKKTSAWELSVGGAYASTPVGSKVNAGFFLKTQQPGWRLGGGANYEAGATNLAALALLQGAQDAQNYVNSISRVAYTLYGEKETRAKWTMGALAHVVNQFQDVPGAGMQYDTTFWRAVGVLAGLRSGMRVDVSRIDGLTEMLQGYDNLLSQVGQDPSQAASLISAFKNQYSKTYRQVIDKSYLAVQIRKNWSLEFNMVAYEEQGKGYFQQVPDTIYARTLVSWKTGFWRAFVAMPLLASGAMESPGSLTPGAPTLTMGLAGTGVGFDLFDSVMLQRIAMDAGAIVGRAEVSTDPLVLNKWAKAGFFVQGAVSLYSNIAEDTRAYRRLVQRFETYKQHIRDGTFSKIPAEARQQMLREYDSKTFAGGQVALEDIARGKDFKPSASQMGDLEEGLWRNWFADQKIALQEKFSGRMRVLVGGSGYHFMGDKTYWDIGAFVEYVDRFKMYAIVSKRQEYGVFAGAEYEKARIRGAIAGGVMKSNAAGAASLGYKFVRGGMPMEAGISFYGTSSKVPEYVAPMYRFYTPREQSPEFGGFIYFTIGGRGVPQFMPSTGGTPTMALPPGYNY